MINKKRELYKAKRELWKKAEDALRALYGDMPDIRILNRFYSEKMIFGNGDSIILWDIVAEIRRRAREGGYTATLGGTDGSCFTAYLLGMCENPLPLHYVCPVCKKTEPVNERALPWDMPRKVCECGGEMRADGFDIPFEAHISMAHGPCPNLWINPEFMEEAKQIARERAGDLYRICTLTKPDFAPAKFVFLPFDGEADYEENVDTADDKYDDFPRITIIPLDIYKCIERLYEATGEGLFGDAFSKKVLSDHRVIEAFANGDIDNVPNFTSKFLDMKEALRLAFPRSYYDLLKFMGAMHGTNTWCNNAERLLRDGSCPIGAIPTHRDEVFMLLRDKLREAGHEDVGIAYNLAMKIRCGIFARNGIDAESHALLEYLDLPEWFITYAEKIQYMFPKAHNIESLRIALTFMWYKINYPEAFEKCVEWRLKYE